MSGIINTQFAWEQCQKVHAVHHLLLNNVLIEHTYAHVPNVFMWEIYRKKHPLNTYPFTCSIISQLVHATDLEGCSPHLLHHVSEVNGLCTTDRRSPMVVHQLIKGIEFDHPQKIFSSTISQHFKMLYTASKSRQREGGRVTGRGRRETVYTHALVSCTN